MSEQQSNKNILSTRWNNVYPPVAKPEPRDLTKWTADLPVPSNTEAAKRRKWETVNGKPYEPKEERTHAGN